MPEGHTLHGLARRFRSEMQGRVVRASSPQGRFADGAALLDGTTLERTDAHGKHLWLRFGRDRWLHVHLGLYGSWTFGQGEPEEPRGQVRLRLAAGTGSTGSTDGAGLPVWADLRAPTACEVQTPQEKLALQRRLGPDPLRRDGDPEAFVRRLRASRAPVAGLLMQQEVLSGVGNVFRAEALFRSRLDPYVPGREVPAPVAEELWTDVSSMLRDGLRRGRIVTTRPEHRTRRRSLLLEDAHYVYRRVGLPCRLCGTPVVSAPLAARTLYWCPSCQSA